MKEVIIMDRYTVITAAAIIIIIVPFAISAINITSAEQLQYRWDSPGMFSFFKMSTDGKLEFCNTMPFWADIERFDVIMYYQGEMIGTYAVTEPFTVNPLSSNTQKGAFTSEHISRAHSMLMTIDHEFSSGESRIDARQFVIKTVISTPILGLVPYDVTAQMSGHEFNSQMNAEDLYCN